MSDNILYEKRPSPEAVARYRRLLELYLSAHRATVEVVLWDRPLVLTMSVDRVTEVEYHWIQEVKVESPTLGAHSVRPHNVGIDESMANSQVWLDAFVIQDEMYRENGIVPSSPPVEGDPYWSLWRYVSDQTK